MEAEVTKNKTNAAVTFKNIVKRVWKALHNATFLYVVKRILSSLLTLFLLIAVVTALIRLLPDTMFYSRETYQRLKGKSGLQVAENYRIATLYKYGILDLEGNRIPVISSIFQYIYWILPIKKKIAITWSTDYSTVLKYWEGIIYLGRSTDGKFVIDKIKSRMGISFTISIICIFFNYLFSIPLGIAMAKKPGGTIDKIGNAFIVLNYAIPALVFYLLLNQWMGNANGPLGALKFGFSYNPDRPQSLIPPIFCVVFLSIPGLAIWIRRFMIDELSSDYVKFARSKGLSEGRIMYTHVLRNAMIPLVRGIPATLITAFIGSYYIEYIWGIPGTGILLVNALQSSTPDVPTIEGLTILYSAMAMISFLLGDLITVFFDPRIKLED